MRDELRRVALFGSGVAELTRHRADQIARELVKAGELRGKEASYFVRDLLARSKENRKEIMRLVRSEIQNQIAGLGVATKRDVERLERRVARLEAGGKAAARGSKKPATKKKSSSASTKTTASRSSGS